MVTNAAAPTQLVQGSQDKPPGILAGGLIVLGVVVGDIILVQFTQPLFSIEATGLPTLSVAAVVADLGIFIAIVALGVAGWFALRRTMRFTRIALVLKFLLVFITASAVALSVKQWDTQPIPQYLRQAPGATATLQAERALEAGADSWTCVVVTRGSDGPMPAPYQRCEGKGLGRVTYTKDWLTGSPNVPSWSGLVYLRDSMIAEPDSCIRRLDAHWWSWMAAGDPDTPCAPGFEFQGGG